MPLTDSKGQNVPFPVLTDKPNARSFGENMVEALAGQLVMRFPSRSVRGATLTTPEAGMMSWIDDLALMEMYDGDNWTAVASGQTVWTDFPLAAPWTDGANSNGDFQYRVVNLFGQDTIMFRGAISRTWPTNPVEPYVLTSSPLPVGARPVTLRTISVPCSDAGSDRISLKIDLRTNGEVALYGVSSTARPAWVGFNGTFVSL
ncbi:hypothetical protein [Streptomyces sp. NPDC101393]|uniref:hypothetical protein n=1 Tax=Streptomyces sp. NPDC101393 TaxID=3366141 RepID=UPI00381AEB1D